MKDPVQGDRSERELFDKVWQMMIGRTADHVLGVALNLLVNVIRQRHGKRKDAEAMFNQLTGRAKTILLDGHYDSVTGERRSVFPFTQVVQAPFHDERSVIFHGR